MKRTITFLVGVAILLFTGSIGVGQEDIDSIIKAEEKALQEIMDKDQAYKDHVEELTNLYQARITQEYEEYEAAEARRLKDMEDAIRKKWADFRFDTQEEMVDYSADLNARSSVNFKEGTVEVEVIEDAGDAAAQQKAAEEIKKKLAELAVKKSADNKPILKDQVRLKPGKNVTAQNAQEFAEEVVKEKPLKKKTYSAPDGKERVKYSVTVPMVPNHIEIRAKEFRQDVCDQSRRFNIDPRVTFAVMHTESYFNPRARSYVPAFGLMQLVPKSGARDAYIYVYKKDRLLQGDYLFVPKNNIELGCAYLSKIRHVYFGGVKDDKKAYYCAIAAYNTGAGNVARALTGTTKLGAAIDVVNSHDAQWVYERLLRSLPYEETKKYIRTVTERIGIYESWM